jgi:hypothetical protein
MGQATLYANNAIQVFGGYGFDKNGALGYLNE